MYKNIMDTKAISGSKALPVDLTMDEISTVEELEAQNKSFPCLDCDEIFKTEDELNDHAQVKHVRILCNLCTFASNNEIDFELHIQSKHANFKDVHRNNEAETTRKVPSVPQPDQLKSCDYCDYKADTKEKLDDHVKEAHKEMRLKRVVNKKGKSTEKLKPNCSRCLLAIGNKHKLDCVECKIPTHITCLNLVEKERKEEYKSGRRGFQCSECKKVRLGLKKVCEELLLTCEVCDFKTKEEGDLLTHIKDVHDNTVESFKCEQCDCVVKTDEMLNQHIQDKHEKFKCSMCDHETKTKEDFENHLETHAKLVDGIISNMEKHLKEKCDHIF